ncbi:MAG: SpoIIE family protein phosphatase [Pirellulales bacterium]|nr:SpoIIE family protein phosphatase [Pirellulales bacterium]
MATLQVVKGLNPGQVFAIEGQRAVLGRHPDCDIVLDVGAVSRQHAQISLDAGDYFVEDLHSRNGTMVNGKLIEGRYKLQENDRLKICDLLFTFHQFEPNDGGDSQRDPEGATRWFDDETSSSSSTVMSTMDVSKLDHTLRLNVRPEVKLRALLEITDSLGQTLELDTVLPKILDSLFKIFAQADRGLVVLRDERRNLLIPKAVKHRRAGEDEELRLSRTIINQAMNSREAILSADATSDSQFQMSQSVADFRIRSVMCAPLLDTDGRALGVIQLDTSNQRSAFQREDLDVLASIARQAAVAIENAQMHENQIRQQRIQRDLELAHQVQRGFLPAEPPKVAGYDFFDYYQAAHMLGGDYYDYVELPGGRLAIVVADVAGKGIPAAMLAARLSADVRYCLALEREAAAAVNRINASFAHSPWQDRFITFVLAVLDTTDQSLTIVNAGHPLPLLRRQDRTVVAIGDAETGLPLGIDEDSRYEAVHLRLEPGEAIAMFTDGFTEAMNAQGELLGVEKLHEFLAAPVDGVAALGRNLLENVRSFVGQHPQSDDMCLACLGRVR